STCARKSKRPGVGCVLVNAAGEVLATGYNGVPRGFPHCDEGHPCPGANAASGTQLHECFAVHAEQNALLQCRDVNEIHTAYVTDAPCEHCVKLLLNTSCVRIVYDREYPHAHSQALWQKVPVLVPGKSNQYHIRSWHKFKATETDSVEARRKL